MKNTVIVLLSGLLLFTVYSFDKASAEERHNIEVIQSTPIIQSYNNSRYFLIKYHRGDVLHIYNKSGVEVMQQEINTDLYVVSVDRHIGTVTLAINGYKHTYTVDNVATFERPLFKGVY